MYPVNDYVYMRGGKMKSKKKNRSSKGKRYVKGFYNKKGQYVKGFYASRKKKSSVKRKVGQRGKGLAKDIAIATAKNFGKVVPDILTDISNRTSNEKVKKVLNNPIAKKMVSTMSSFLLPKGSSTTLNNNETSV